MGLLSLFQRHPRPDDAPHEPSPAEPDAVVAARTRARRRLIGAAVLLGIGVVGFPLLFETQPRPVPVDIPIEIPRKDGAPPLTPPAASPALSAASAAVVLPDAEVPAAPKRPAEITERAADAGREVTLPASATAAPQAAAVPPVQAPSPSPAPVVAAAKPAASVPRPAASAPRAAASAARPAAEAARAQALLNGQATTAPAAASAAGARVVVQVGAYTEPAKLKEARAKVEKLGFKTYTQVVEVDGAKRTRVRIGPFATKTEADKAAARIKASGLPAAILAL